MFINSKTPNVSKYKIWTDIFKVSVATKRSLVYTGYNDIYVVYTKETLF